MGPLGKKASSWAHILFWCVLFPMSVFPRTYTTYCVPDRGQGIYKKIPSQYPAWCHWGQKNRFFSAYQGIYRKIVALHPIFCDQRGMDTQFFCIYPVSLYKPGKKGEFAKRRGTAEQLFYIYPAGSKDDQNRPASVGAATNRSCTPRGDWCRIWTAFISRFVGGQSGGMQKGQHAGCTESALCNRREK